MSVLWKCGFTLTATVLMSLAVIAIYFVVPYIFSAPNAIGAEIGVMVAVIMCAFIFLLLAVIQEVWSRP